MLDGLAGLLDKTAIDGEVVALDEQGRPSFNQNAGECAPLRVRSGSPIVFDLFMDNARLLATSDNRKEDIVATLRQSLALVVIPALASGALAVADSATATIAVSATVRRNCTIATAPVAFGSYDPVVANATTPLDASATVTIACTMGTPANIGLDDGSNASATQRRLTNGSNAFMDYQVYLDSGYATVWGSDVGNRLDAGTSPSKTPREFPVYARVPAGQDIPIGPYTDSVVATVNF